MSPLRISHHELVPGHRHRWRVHLHGRERPVLVELPPGERRQLDLTDEEVDALLPTALQRQVDADPGALPEEAAWDAPVRVLQTHFMA